MLPSMLRWPLTIVFVIVAGYCVLRCALPTPDPAGHGLTARASDLAHAAMGTSMVAMLWAWTGHDPWGVQTAVFAVAAGWFLVRALDSGRRPGGHAPGHGTRLGLVHQAVAMAATLWMIQSVSTPASASAASLPRMSMAGMAVPGGQAGRLAALPSAATTLAMAGYLAVATVWWLRRCRIVRTAEPHAFGPVTDAACQALMTTAMSLALLVTLW